jgi:hypothetical protein
MIKHLALCLFVPAFASFAEEDGTSLARNFSEEVNRRLNVPESEQQQYAGLLANALADRNLSQSQYVVIVDRNPNVQALMIYWMEPDGAFRFIGASGISTGLPGRFDHFRTPLGVFEHTVDNPDFRAEGTKNELGIRGYGRKGMRIFDFGWQQGERGWGPGGRSPMRFQMHATDPDILESRLGTAQSKGCVRIPASLNVFLDRHGILDGDYDEAIAQGKSFWVFPVRHEPQPWAGRFLVVLDSRRKTRPEWSPLPGKNQLISAR